MGQGAFRKTCWRRWPLDRVSPAVGELVERFKNLGVCATRASVTAALAELGLELETLELSRRGACSSEEPNGSWRPNQSS